MSMIHYVKKITLDFSHLLCVYILKSMPTPAKIFIRRLTKAAEQFQADLSIQKKQYDELHAVVIKRSERKSIKR
jgi:hypothetical protein